MGDLRELGIRPRRRNPYPPATASQVDEFEAHFGVSLPQDYVRFLLVANGGRPALREFVDPLGGISEVNDFYGLGTREADIAAAREELDGWDYGNLWGETRVRRPFVGPRGVPFARDGGDNQYFFNYDVDPPCVSRLNSSTRKSYRIAANFSEFLDKLHRPAVQ